MNVLSFLMFIFALLIFIVGLYIYTGHDVKLLLWKVYYRNVSKKELKNIGMWTMIVSVIPLIIAIIALFMDI